MLTLIKVIVILVSLLLLAFPMLKTKRGLKKISPINALKYDKPDNKKNVFFVFLATLVIVAIVLCTDLIYSIVDAVYKIPFVGDLFADIINKVGVNVVFIFFVIFAFIINLIVLYGYSILKAILKKIVNSLYDIPDKKEKTDKKEKEDIKKKAEAEKIKKEKEEEEEKEGKIPKFIHAYKGKLVKKKEEKKEDGDISRINNNFFSRLFFVGPDYEYAKGWVTRSESILQCFVNLVKVLYLLTFALLLTTLLFPVSNGFYTIIIDVLHVDKWYIYPYLSLILLQEICNTLHTGVNEDFITQDVKQKIKEPESESRIKVRSLQSELKKRFDGDHILRYYPAKKQTKKIDYVSTSKAFGSALNFIKNQMQANNVEAGQKYLESLDAMYNGHNVYFNASFYSEFGEYLISYTYTRLLSGSRMIFILSDGSKKDYLRKYILKRLTKMTGCTEQRSWRVYTSEERLDQADILIASPDDFKDDNITEHYPDFFEEACNAVFIDADRIVSMESYLCPIMALRLQVATDNRIRFIFLSKDLIRGFATASLPKFFCVDKVFSFSSAQDNENVDFTLWNKESLHNRIYERNGQKLTSLEGIIAALAYDYGVDGVRIVSKHALEYSEKKILQEHNVEINEFHKEIPRVNYMIYTDENYNLSAAIYACTRFRGTEESVVHIISKPYLLRDFFASRAMRENYVKRASFIQPRATEHAEKEKLSLLKIFCQATTVDGMKVVDFVRQMKDILSITKVRGDIPLCEFCADEEKFGNINELNVKNAAAYMVAGLCDDYNTLAKDSMGNKARDYYLIVDHAHRNATSIIREKYIVFKKVKEIFEKLLANNERVELRLNDKTIGYLDTFPARIPLEYTIGQTIVYDNTEYEIEQISDDCKIVFLRRENVTFQNCFDTFFLRRYVINDIKKLCQDGVLYNSNSMLEEIRVSLCGAKIEGETYGFYNLMSNNQYLDFIHGVEGNPHIDKDIVEKSKRRFENGRLLRVKLTTRMECTDGMRILLSTVFNEFIKTIFPQVYRCIAVCPVLENPLDFTENKEAETIVEKIQTLYPYIREAEGELVETSKNSIQLLIINDCIEDVGVFDWLYDKGANYMHEFLINIYSYLNWLNLRKDLRHFIYFGDQKLAECFDLEGCCKLFEGFSFTLSDDGKTDYQTAGTEEDIYESLRCSFCHNLMESGRYMSYDKDKYICADCMDVVEDEETLSEVYNEVSEYLKKNYPAVEFGYLGTKFFDIENESHEGISEWFFKLDPDKRIVTVQDLPYTNMKVALLCAIISMWQIDNNLVTQYSDAQLSYEEMKFLTSIDKGNMVEWIKQNMPEDRKENVAEIEKFINPEQEISQEGEQTDEPSETDNDRTSFAFMIEKGAEEDNLDQLNEEVEIEGEDFSYSLYDPNKIPRFWKRYFRGDSIDNGEEDSLEGAEMNGDIDDGDDEMNDEENNIDSDTIDNASLSERLILYVGQKDNAPFDDGEESPEEEIIEEEEESPEEEIDEDDSVDQDEDGDSSEEDIDGMFGFGSGEEDGETDSETDSDEDLDSIIDASEDEDEEDDDTETNSDTKGKKEKNKNKEKKEKKEKKKKEKRVKGKTSEGWKKVPQEDDEETNPKIKFYNTIVRNAYDFIEEPISRADIPDDDEMLNIFYCALNDYPELFWLNNSVKYNSESLFLTYRCKNAEGKFDFKQINRKLKELRKGAAYYIKGINKRTSPYDAFLTIYKRLILTIDYDGKGLDSGIDADMSQDDRLRSLHSAIVRHKTVCAGYAVALQYLLQMVGITCGYVSSEVSGSSSHAFNIVKIGKLCYYVDVTWGDRSNTKGGDKDKDVIDYDYCLVPYEEFIMTSDGQKALHIPNKKKYPFLNELHANVHEYYRYHKAFVTRYNEDDIVRIMVNAVEAYDPKEDGRFSISFRCSSISLAKKISSMLINAETYRRIESKAKMLIKNKKARQLLDKKYIGVATDVTSVVKLVYQK